MIIHIFFILLLLYTKFLIETYHEFLSFLLQLEYNEFELEISYIIGVR